MEFVHEVVISGVGDFAGAGESLRLRMAKDIGLPRRDPAAFEARIERRASERKSFDKAAMRRVPRIRRPERPRTLTQPCARLVGRPLVRSNSGRPIENQRTISL
jgi:hypothetical protein